MCSAARWGPLSPDMGGPSSSGHPQARDILKLVISSRPPVLMWRMHGTSQWYIPSFACMVHPNGTSQGYITTIHCQGWHPCKDDPMDVHGTLPRLAPAYMHAHTCMHSTCQGWHRHIRNRVWDVPIVESCLVFCQAVEPIRCLPSGRACMGGGGKQVP